MNENFTALINPNGTIATTTRHPAGHADGHAR